MGNFDTRNTFTLSRNDKGDNPKRPDYRGFYTDGTGKEWALAAWERQGPKGPFLSGKVSEKREREQGGGGGRASDGWD